MEIEAIKGNLLEQKVDVIVNPANVTGYMGYGVAKAIIAVGGAEIEKEALDKAPILLGDPIITGAGKLPFKAIVHTATIDDSRDKVEKGIIGKAVINALFVADEKGYASIAIPGIGSGTGGVSKKVAAEMMVEAIRSFNPIHLQKIILVDLNDEMVEEWEKALKKKGKKK